MGDDKQRKQREADDAPPVFAPGGGGPGKAPASHKRYGGGGANKPNSPLTFHLGGSEQTPPADWYERGETSYLLYKQDQRFADQAKRRTHDYAARVGRGTSKQRAEAQRGLARSSKQWTDSANDAAGRKSTMAGAAPFAVSDIWTDASTFAANIELTLLYSYSDIRIDVVDAGPDDIDRIVDACRRAGSRISQLSVRGVAVTPAQFVALAGYFSWGDKATTQVNKDKAIDTASPEGRRERARKANMASLSGRTIEFANAPKAPKGAKPPTGLSTLGSASKAQIEQLLALVAADPDHTPGQVLDAHARKTKSASAALINSRHPQLGGKSLMYASQLIAGFARRTQDLLDRLQGNRRTWRGWSQQWHDKQTLALAEIRDADVSLGNAVTLFAKVMATFKDVDRVAKPMFAAVDDKKVRKQMVVIRGEMHAYFPGSRKVCDAFFGLKVEEIMHLEALYSKTYDADLRSDIEAKIHGIEQRELLAYLRLDLAGAAALRIEGAVSFTGLGDDDEQRMFDTLRKIPADVRRKLAGRKGDAKTSKDENPYKASLDKARGALGGVADHEKNRFDALLAGNMVKADALALMHHLGTDGFTGNPLRWTENEDEALKIIRGKTKQHIAKVAAAYKRLAKRTLITDLDLLDEFQTQEAKFIAEGDKHKSLAARLQDAAAGVGTKNDVVKQVYGGASQADRAAIDKAFASLYGSRWKGGKTAIENMFASEAEYDWEAAAWNSYRTTGKLEPGLALYIAMVGIGTDDAAVYKTLGEMKASDKMKVCEAFRDACVKYGDYDRKPDAEKMLRSWISADMDGGDFKRAEFLLFGKAETPKQMLEDITRREQNATRDELGVNLTRQFNGGIAADLSKLKKQLSAMVDLNTGKTKLNPATGKPYSTEDVRTIYEAGRGSIDQLAAAKTAIADALATGVEVSVAALTILISGSAATPFWVGLWSGMAALGTKALIQGSDRSLETLSADALKVLITSAAGHALRETGKFGTWVVELTNGFGEPIAREMAKDAILGLVQESAKGTVEGLFNAPNWREGVAEWLAGAGKKALKDGVKGAFDGAVSGAVKGAWQRDKGKLAGNVGPDGRNDGFDAANMDEAFVEELLGIGAIKVFEVAGDIDGHAKSPTKMLKVIAGTIVTAALEAAKSRRKNRTQMGKAIEADAKWLEYNKHLITRQLLARLEPHQFQELYARKTSANTLRTLQKLYAEARASAQAHMDLFPSNDMGTPPPAPPLAPLPSGRDTAPAADTREPATRRQNDESWTDDPPPAPPLAPLPEGRQLAR